MFFISSDDKHDTFKRVVSLNGKDIEVLLDTGASRTMINKQTANKCNVQISDSDLNLCDYSGNAINILGCAKVDLKFKDFTQKDYPIVVVEKGKNLLGRDFLNQLNDNFVLNVQCKNVHLRLRSQANPVFIRPRPLPFSIKDRVKNKIDEMVKKGILQPITSSEWGTPLVVVKKPNGDLRLCGDYKVTLNPHLEDSVSTTPGVDDIFAQIGKAKIFTRLDLKDAYLQLPLDGESVKLTTLTTPFGLFAFSRLPFGIKSSPAIFQKYLDEVLLGINGCISYQDDILIYADTLEEHDKILETVKTKLTEGNLKINNNKCEYKKTKFFIWDT